MRMNEKTFEIVLYGRNKCHLCDEVELYIRSLAEEFPLRMRMVDIESDPALHEEMMFVIPVVEIDGEIVFRSITHVVTLKELHEELHRRTALS
ncbi:MULTISPECIES: glutaredoxin family protein [Brevibacillus]|uniref:glutaredoxin family protein n=1 Tax=Brevibacillus TaxID=55080 RepID=UPI00156AC70C|nr:MULTISPECIES: glutaredoxin family protein [Bacillales]NRR06204.1 glutaredoxin family protein [Brevibacillus sp. RS1.1]UIO42016.1 glutaredoxin family protein [Brevibacillus brevis]WGV59524.1 glutaredoxin family protein [Brevibacillus brevis]